MTTLLDVQGRRTVGYLVNKSGGAVVKGDVVIVDASNDEAFTTSTTGAEIVAVGVVAEENGIASNASGRVVFAGYVDLITVSSSVTRGHFGKTHTVAKQAVDAGTSRVVGVFCEFLKSGTTPSAWLFGLPDGSTGSAGLIGGTPALTFGTANSAGVATSAIRTDATLAIFDATAPVTQAFADAAAAGSAGVAARRDHKHGMPASGGVTQSYVGNNSAPGGTWDNLGGTTAQKICLKKITMATAGFLASVGIYAKGDNAHGSQISAAVLSDNSGVPLRVIARGGGQGGSNLNLGMDATGRYVDTAVGIWLPAADYWLAVQGLADSGGTFFDYAAGGSDYVYAGSNNEIIWDHAFANYSSGSNNYSIRGTVLR